MKKMKWLKRTILSAVIISLCFDLIPFFKAVNSFAKTETGIVESDFEDGTTQGWYVQGTANAKVQVVSNQSNSGSKGLLVTGRQEFYDRATYELKDKLVNGNTYKYTAWVKFSTKTGDTRKFSVFTCKVDTTNPNGSYAAPEGAYAVTVKSGEWTKIEGALKFEYSGSLSSYSVYIEISDENSYDTSNYDKNTPIIDYYIDDVTVQEYNPKAIQTDIPSLYQELADYFPIGAAMEPYQLDDTLHTDLLAKHFNSLVAENCMKFGSIEPTENNFDFTGADKLVDFAIKNNMSVRGHNLLWYMGMPDWLFKHTDGTPLVPGNEADKELLISRLKNHITKTIQHFDEKYGVYGEPGSKNPVYCWDVVNEPINDMNGTLRDDLWNQIIGPEYVQLAFKFAREANPNIELYLNEYFLEDPIKGDGIFNLAKSLVDQGVPIDGVGYQAHVDLESPSIESMKLAIERYAAIGLKVQITELDMTTQGKNDVNTLIEQGYRYKQLFDMFKEEAKAGTLTGVTFWGLADDHNYQNTLIANSAPLFFNEMLQAKPAYWGIVDPDKMGVYIQRTNVLKGSPRINTKIDRIWYAANANKLSVNNVIKGSKTPATIRTMWDTKYLYILAEVKDRTINKNDGIEIFIDRNNDKSTSYGPDDSHYKITYKGMNKDRLVTAAKNTSDGYVLQVRIPISDIKPVKEMNIGFDIRVNDYNRKSKLVNTEVWNDITNNMDTDPSKFGILKLDHSATMTSVLKGTPTIDGAIDRIWSGAHTFKTLVPVNGTKLGATAKVRTLWDTKYLYVLAEVKDSSLDASGVNAWEQDSVEVFIDQNNGKTISYESDDAQYRVNFKNVLSINGGNQKLFKSATSKTTNGYIVEMAIPIASNQIGDGDVIGFDVQINDATNGVRTGLAMWCDESGNSYKNTSGLGNAAYDK